MKFLAALLALTGFVHAAAPSFPPDAISKTSQTGGDLEFAVKINPGGEDTDLWFYLGEVGVGDIGDPQKDDTIPSSTDIQSRPFSLQDLAGGKNYYVRAEARRNGLPLDPPVVTDPFPFEVKPYSTFTLKPPVITAPSKSSQLSVKLRASIAASGGTIDAGSVIFKYGLTSGVYDQEVAGMFDTTTVQDYTATITNTTDTDPLRRGVVYHYQVVAKTSGNETASDDATFTTPANRAPIATADQIKLSGDRATLIDVLKNDRDPDGDALKLVSVTQGKQGKVEIVGNQIKYTPIADADQGDSFSYTVRDDYEDPATTGADTKSATTTVTIVAPGLNSRGLHAAELKDADGNVVGLIRLTGTGDGSVTGKVQLFTQTYSLMGRIDANGHFYYTVPRDENGPLQLDVDFSGEDEDGGFDVSIEGDGKFWTGEEVPNTLTDARRDELVGKYTVELPASGGDDQPQGTGFARLDIKPWGEVSIKGRLGDGSKFSTKGVLTGSDTAPVVSMFATPGDTRLRANFQLGSVDANLTGPLVWYREADSDGMFPNGIYAEITMNGSRFDPTENGRSLKDAKKATITLTDGNLTTTITQAIEISKSDRVNFLGSNPFGVTLKIDRENGTFKGQFDHPFDDSRRKFLGVLLQAQEKGSGVFTGVNQTGAVSLTIGLPASTPTPTPTPTTPTPTTPTSGRGF